jgi:hypothetical protein
MTEISRNLTDVGDGFLTAETLLGGRYVLEALSPEMLISIGYALSMSVTLLGLRSGVSEGMGGGLDAPRDYVRARVAIESFLVSAE